MCGVMRWSIRLLPGLPQVLLAVHILCIIQKGSSLCAEDRECGWNSHCKQSECQCIPGYVLSKNGQDCVDSSCDDPRCLECPSVDRTCRRCINFIEASTGKCLDKCDATYVLAVEGDQVGRVCPVRQGELMTLYIAIIIGIGVGIVLTGLLGIGFYFKFRTDRDRRLRVQAMQTVMEREKQHRLHKEEMREDSAYDNHAYEIYTPEEKPPAQLSYLQKVTTLRAYSDTFQTMLNEAIQKQSTLSPDDKRCYVYRNVIHQLRRILSILNQTSGHLIIPPDGEGLLTWGHRVLQTYLHVNQPSSSESPESGTGTMTSTFKPDLQLVPNGSIRGDNSSPGSNTFKYQRCGPATEEIGVCEEMSSVQLMDEFTEPIEV